MFEYKSGYTYDEFASMCDLFKEVHLPFLSKYEVNRIVSEYIFGYSMKRFPIGKKHTLRRFFGGVFSYQIDITGSGNLAFVFTGDGNGRPDYIAAFDKVLRQAEDSIKILLNRTKLKFRCSHLSAIFLELFWAKKLNKIIHNFDVSFDMAVFIYRTQKQGYYIYRKMKALGIKKVVTFCDTWAIESVVAQKCCQDGMNTATLQHGNGTEIMYGSSSDYYLTNSMLSKKNCIYAGIPEKSVVVVGPMKYAGEAFEYADNLKVRKIGIVFDGAHNFDNNVEMLQIVHAAAMNKEITCCIRFHPNNRREDYQPYLFETDVIYDNLNDFEKDIDICIVYNSSMYTDMIYKRIPVYRFKNGKVDLFPEISDQGFTDINGLKDILMGYINHPKEQIIQQNLLYQKVFGDECGAESYRIFFKNQF